MECNNCVLAVFVPSFLVHSNAGLLLLSRSTCFTLTIHTTVLSCCLCHSLLQSRSSAFEQSLICLNLNHSFFPSTLHLPSIVLLSLSHTLTILYKRNLPGIVTPTVILVSTSFSCLYSGYTGLTWLYTQS